MNTQPGYAYAYRDHVLVVNQGTVRIAEILDTTGRSRAEIGWHNGQRYCRRRCTVLNDIEEWLVNPNQRCLLVNSLPTLLVLETSNKRMSQVRHLFHEAVDTSK